MSWGIGAPRSASHQRDRPANLRLQHCEQCQRPRLRGWSSYDQPVDQGARAELLLAGPRGRRLCLNVAIGVEDSLWASHLNAAWDLGNQKLLIVFLDGLVRVDVERVASTSDEAAMLDALAGAVGDASYWGEPSEYDTLLSDPRVVGALWPVASAVAVAPAAAWWDTPVALNDQHFVSWMGDRAKRAKPPALQGAADRLACWKAATIEDERDAHSRPVDPSAPYSGCWWSTPNWPGIVTTSRRLGPLHAVQLRLVEDSIGDSPARVSRLQPRPGCRVYEVTAPGDWVDLVARYPLDVDRSRRHDWWRTTGSKGPWLIPDWSAVAADYDGVHLTVLGYLGTAGRALPVGHAVTLLAGWEPDVTYWLADVLDQATPSITWSQLRSEPYGRAPDIT